MRRARLFALLLGVSALLCALPLVASAATSDSWALAQTETQTEPAEEAPLGPEPHLENTFNPPEYVRDWTWGLGVVLTAVGVLAAGGTAMGYYLLVWRPPRDSEAR